MSVRQCPATLLYHICGSNSVLFHFTYTFVNIISHKRVCVCKYQLLFFKSHSLATAGFLNIEIHMHFLSIYCVTQPFNLNNAFVFVQVFLFFELCC